MPYRGISALWGDAGLCLPEGHAVVLASTVPKCEMFSPHPHSYVMIPSEFSPRVPKASGNEQGRVSVTEKFDLLLMFEGY